MVHRLLLDTSSLTYRAFFALPATITDPDGRPVNAVRGVLDMHARLVADRAPDEVLHVFDADWRPAERVAAFPGYKAERPPDPEGLPEQFDLLRALLDALGLPRVEAPGWEADDAIGTLCATGRAADRLDIVTGDRDLLQLVRDDGPVVRVLYTVRGVTELAIFDEAAVEAKYGVPPSRYVDFAILRGDPSDGLPGVRGVGEKSARDLVGRYPDLDALLADAEAHVAGAGSHTAGRSALTPARARRLAEARAYVRAMRAVVPVRGDVELAWHCGCRDDALVERLAAQRGLEGPVNRLREVLDA